jgi:hypothetical protein
MSKIVAYACSARPNALWSAAQFDNAAPKNRTECDIPLVALSDLNADKAMCDEMAKALEVSNLAIEDWLHIYAPDECKSERVAEAYARIREHGTLAYIASVLSENRSAIAAYDKAQEVGNG